MAEFSVEFWKYVNAHDSNFFWFCVLVVLPALAIIVNGIVGVFRALMRVPVVHNHVHNHDGSPDDEEDEEDEDDEDDGSDG